MSIARPVFKNVQLMMTRRVGQRTFLLRPSKRTNRIVRYIVAVMQKKWNIQVYAMVTMSNHWHVCLGDVDGNVVAFQRDCHSFIARAVNAAHGDFESLWSSAPTSRVECDDTEDMISKIAYTLANPVEGRLVRNGKSWPGVRHAWPCAPRVVGRPPKFFRGEDDGGGWPEEAELEFSRPPGYEELSDEELAGMIEAATEQREERFRREFDKKGKAFVGRRQILAQSRYGRPATAATHFGISPKLACRDKWRRIERLQANQCWAQSYAVALEAWRAGDRTVIFPAGTYQMRVVHAVNCAAPPG